MVEPVSFTALSKVHRWLDELFLDHQLVLLSLDLGLAWGKLQRYDDALQAHMLDEESWLIPVYQARTSNVPGGAVELFTGEHTKLKGFVAEFFQTVTELQALSSDQLKPAVIKLLDRQAICKGLVEHHHAREENILFPWLDQVTSVEERTELLARCVNLRVISD